MFMSLLHHQFADYIQILLKITLVELQFYLETLRNFVVAWCKNFSRFLDTVKFDCIK